MQLPGQVRFFSFNAPVLQEPFLLLLKGIKSDFLIHRFPHSFAVTHKINKIQQQYNLCKDLKTR